jgi:penicillin-binding protein 1A
VPSLALGASDVTLVSLTAAYGAFANEGIVRQPVLIRRVEDGDHHVLYEDAGNSHRAVSESTAFLMSSMLADVINSGTAYRARQTGFTLPAAGKTGTTNDYVDAWFVGFTPHLVTGVWIGFDQPTTIISNGYAGELAVPVWASFMKAATKGDKADWFDRPANVVTANVCRLSGKLPNGGCDHVEVVNREGGVEIRSMIYTEYFVKGTQPTELCPLHPSPSFMDRLAGIFGGGESNKPIRADDAALPPAGTGTAGAHSPPAPPPHVEERQKDAQTEATPQKKRGFWARVFGKGDKKDDDKDRQDEKDKDEKKKKER